MLVHERVDGAEHARRVGSHQVVLVPEGAHLADAGQPRQSAFLVVLELAVKRYLDRLRFGGRLLQPFGSVDSDELRAVYDGDPLAELVSLFHVVGGDENGDPLVVQVAHDIADEPRALDVEAGGRLVQEHDLRAVHHGHRNGEAPAQPEAQLDGFLAPVLLQPEQ